MTERRYTALLASAIALLLLADTVAAGRVRPAHDGGILQVERSPVAPGPTPERAAREHARALVAAAEVPAGAHEVRRPPSPRLAQPATVVGSPYLVVASRFWTWPGSFAAARSYFLAREENGQPPNGHGDTRDRAGPMSGFVQWGELQISYAPVDDTTTGIRADAEVLWVPDKPPTERVPDGVRTVTVLAYRLPNTVLARKVVTGDEAQHLAELANAMVRDNSGAHGCTADFGYRRRLTFTTDGGNAVADGFFCGSVLLSVGGVRQPPLSQSPELTDEIERLLGPVPSTP